MEIEKMEAALKRAGWTFFQVLLGMLTAAWTNFEGIDFKYILFSALTAALLSIAKSLTVGTPETEQSIPDGTMYVTLPPSGNAYVDGGIVWNQDFNLKKIVEDNPTKPQILLDVDVRHS